MRRAAASPELLDGPLHDVDALAGNLRDLARFNRYLFGAGLSVRAVRTLLDVIPATRAPRRVLDVGTGGADIPAVLLERLSDTAGGLEVVAVDSRPEVVSVATGLHDCDRHDGRLVVEVADGFALPYPDDAFDVAHASLVLHHLDPEEAAIVLAEMARVARGVVVNDLLRSRRAWLGARALTLVATRNRFTRNDAPLSVRRAYDLTELLGLVRASVGRPVATYRDPLRHRVAISALSARPTAAP